MKSLALVLVALCVALSACGTAKLHQAADTPQTKQAEQKSQRLIQACAFAGRKKAVEACLQRHGVTQQCGEHAVQGANFLTHAGRQAFLVKLEGCAR